MHVKLVGNAPETWISNLPQSLQHEFSHEELEQMKQQFCDFDESGDGSIAASELVVLMKSMGIDVTLDEVQNLIDKVDDNRSGELEYPEFVRLISEFRRGNGDKLASFIQYSKLALAIRLELQQLSAEPTMYSKVTGVKESAWDWNVIISGPEQTPYEGAKLHFHVTFGRDYPYQPPSFVGLTRIYHPNFVPLLNGKMLIPGFMERWQPEWRMRGLLERVETLLVTPDVDLMTSFYDDSERQLSLVSNADGSAAKRKVKHPREITLECIEMFLTDPDQFRSIAHEVAQSNRM